MTTARRLHYTYAEYLRTLADSDLKLEFHDGTIYAMAGGTIAHAGLSANATRVLGQHLLGRCAAFSSDLRVRVEATGLSTFPDGTIVCGHPERSPIDEHAVINPSILVEVTSRSTEDYDRGDKLSHYKQLPTLRAVLFVSHRTRCVTIVRRVANGWEERDVRAGEQLTLEEPAVSVPVDALYEGVTLDPS